jgi:hypothetical protein
MGRKHFRLTIAAAMFAAFCGPLQAADLVPLKFEHPATDAAETLAIWKGFGDDEIEKNADKLDVFTARAKTADNGDLVISQLNGPTVCGDNDCPVRVLRDGKLLYDGGGCRYTEEYFLNTSMNTLFMCDIAVRAISETAK